MQCTPGGPRLCERLAQVFVAQFIEMPSMIEGNSEHLPANERRMLTDGERRQFEDLDFNVGKSLPAAMEQPPHAVAPRSDINQTLTAIMPTTLAVLPGSGSDGFVGEHPGVKMIRVASRRASFSGPFGSTERKK